MDEILDELRGIVRAECAVDLGPHFSLHQRNSKSDKNFCLADRSRIRLDGAVHARLCLYLLQA